jgi:hypothetical protein
MTQEEQVDPDNPNQRDEVIGVSAWNGCSIQDAGTWP